MSPLRLPRAARRHPEVRYLRAPSPIHFPEEAQVPESDAHLRVRTFLWQLLEFALGPEHTVGSEQFVYWNARDPTRALAPDVFVRLDVPYATFRTWKTWEKGAPDLAVEIVSASDGPWESKLRSYHELGVRELVRFDPEAPAEAQLRIWDRVEEDLVERAPEERPACLTLGLSWVVTPVDGALLGLRVADEQGRLIETHLEAERRAREEEREAAERARRDAEARADAAEAKLHALEEALRRKGSGG